MAIGCYWPLVLYVLGLVDRIDNRRDWGVGFLCASASYLALTAVFDAPLRIGLYNAGALCCYALAKVQCIRLRCCGCRRLGNLLQTVEAVIFGILGIACFFYSTLAFWAPVLYLVIRTASFQVQDRARKNLPWPRLLLDVMVTMGLLLVPLSREGFTTSLWYLT